jgi:hypothetical protein
MAEAATLTDPEKISLHFELGGNIINGAIVRPMTFAKYSDYITEAISTPAPDDIDARLRRIRMSKQVSYGMPATPPTCFIAGQRGFVRLVADHRCIQLPREAALP